jgi:choline dehydrogenase-like flavoprotein
VRGTGNGRRYDALVIGSGAAGSIAAKELTERGLEVLMLEAGRGITEADFPAQSTIGARKLGGVSLGQRLKSGLSGQAVQARRALFSTQTSPFFVNDRDNPYTTPRGAPYLWIRGRQLGGRLNVYGRVLLRMSDYDFRGATHDGVGRDWPVAYADLAPYYEHVERFLGVYGQCDGLPQLPDGTYVGASFLTKAERNFKEGVKRHWPGRNVVSWRYAAPNPRRIPLGILAAQETGRLTTRLDAIVRRITVDPQTGRATGVDFIDRITNREESAHADVVVVCASAVESIRLLLNSGSTTHPNGLANSSGLVGRYFMDQTPSLSLGTIPEIQGSELDTSAPNDSFYPPAGGVYVPRFHNLNASSNPGFARGVAFQGAMGRFPVGDDQPASFALMGYGEMIARPDNRVTIDPKRTDAWGIPAPQIRCTAADNEVALMREQVRVIREFADTLGYQLTFSGSALGLETLNKMPGVDPLSRLAFRLNFKRSVAIGAAIHECGGVRMGNDPASSVLNEHNQAWDVPNLFVTDGSCFVSNGLVGPTLTIMAITARACEYLAKEHAAGSL